MSLLAGLQGQAADSLGRGLLGKSLLAGLQGRSADSLGRLIGSG